MEGLKCYHKSVTVIPKQAGNLLLVTLGWLVFFCVISAFFARETSLPRYFDAEVSRDRNVIRERGQVQGPMRRG